MATTFKTFLNNDVAATKTMLHEAIPITGSLVSGTYGGDAAALGSEQHIKSYSHGMFQSVYDYPYLSSSANHIFDIAVGISPRANLYGTTTSQKSKKTNIYNQMAQVLVGYDHTGSIRDFDEDGDLTGETSGTKLKEVFFLNFSRLLTKDEVKKGSFQLELGVHDDLNNDDRRQFTSRIRLTDKSGSDGFYVNSPAGEYGVLYANSTANGYRLEGETATSWGFPCGLIYYQAGIAVVSGSVFNKENVGGILENDHGGTELDEDTTGYTGFNMITGSTVDTVANAVRGRIYSISFNNTTELNSSIYFCRANHNDFNYSSNPTYLTGSKIRVKANAFENPVTYITTVGLYSAQNELLAVAKLSEPIKKDPSTELTFRVRLDY